jgi:hypothetical protein
LFVQSMSDQRCSWQAPDALNALSSKPSNPLGASPVNRLHHRRLALPKSAEIRLREGR